MRKVHHDGGIVVQLFTKEIEKKLQSQYKFGAILEKQKVICKIFNPFGAGVWYLLNQDPEDTDYLWCIAILYETEMGSVSKSELENIRVEVLGKKFPLERDISWKPISAKKVWDKLMAGESV